MSIPDTITLQKYIKNFNTFHSSYNSLSNSSSHLYKCVTLVQKYPELIEYINEYIKTDPNIITHDNKTTYTSLHYAALLSKEENYVKVIKMLIGTGANLNKRDPEGFTPLHYVMYFLSTPNQLKALDLLIDAGADIKLRAKFGYTPLHIVILSLSYYHKFNDRTLEYKSQAIRKIISVNDHNLEIADNDGNTALHLLAMKCEIGIVKEILVELIDRNMIVCKKNNKGNDVLFYLSDELKRYSNLRMLRKLQELRLEECRNIGRILSAKL